MKAKSPADQPVDVPVDLDAGARPPGRRAPPRTSGSGAGASRPGPGCRPPARCGRRPGRPRRGPSGRQPCDRRRRRNCGRSAKDQSTARRGRRPIPAALNIDTIVAAPSTGGGWATVRDAGTYVETRALALNELAALADDARRMLPMARPIASPGPDERRLGGARQHRPAAQLPIRARARRSRGLRARRPPALRLQQHPLRHEHPHRGVGARQDDALRAPDPRRRAAPVGLRIAPRSTTACTARGCRRRTSAAG